MVYVHKGKDVAAALAVLVTTSLLVWFGNGLDPWWPLLWFAPLPVLLFALRRPWWSAALISGSAWLLGSLNLLGYFELLGMPFAAWLGFFFVSALVFAVAVLLFRALVLGGGFWTGMLAFPSVWVSFEYLRSLASVHGTAANLAYTQLQFLPVLQLASITGPWGISFLLFLFPAAIAVGLHFRGAAPREAVRAIIAAAIVIVAVVVFGAFRLEMPAPRPDIAVGLVTSDEPANGRMAKGGADTERLFRVYAREAEQLAARGARIVVLPEKLGVVSDSDGAELDSLFQSVADRTGATIVVGEVRITPPNRYNQARIYQPGSSVLYYNKQHLLPPMESDLTPGTGLVTIPRPGGTLGIAICKDMDFIALSRRYGKAGAGLLLVPAWDFNIDRNWHGHMEVMRGVEDGFSVARAAKNGYLTISDSRGRILAEARSDSAPFPSIIAAVSATHSRTVYLWLGDWFAWLSMATLLLSIACVVRVDRMAGRRPPVPELRTNHDDSEIGLRTR